MLYLVNAAEAPAAAGYVEAEMQILGWIGKPVLLLLNQLGPPRGRDADAADEAAWRQHLAPYPRCEARSRWTPSRAAGCRRTSCSPRWAGCCPRSGATRSGGCAPRGKRGTSGCSRRPRRPWAVSSARAATDREPTSAPGFREQAGRWVASVVRGSARPDPGAERAMAALAARLDGALREATDRLISLHGLSGRAADEVLARVARQFETSPSADVAKTSVIGGLVSGALGGLAADLAAGGLSFGAGALIGGILGALGLGGAAQAYNLALDAEQGSVGWSAPFLTERFGAALLRYLAVAHFGRGRGDWVEGEYPPHWRRVVEDVVGRRSPALAGDVGAGGRGRRPRGDRGSAPADRRRCGGRGVDRALPRGGDAPLPAATGPNLLMIQCSSPSSIASSPGWTRAANWIGLIQKRCQTGGMAPQEIGHRVPEPPGQSSVERG